MTSSLSSLPSGYRALIVGSTGGLGSALTKALLADPKAGTVFAASRAGAPKGEAIPLTLDLADENSIKAAIETASEDGPLHLVIAATGLLHDDQIGPEKSWRHLDGDALAKAYQVNAIGPALLAKHALPRLDRETKAVFAALSARVGSISDNGLGGWHAYRASKAALNQILKTLSIELARKTDQALCIGLHPGTVDTGLSEPFQANVPEGKLFSPDYSAACLLAVIDTLGPDATGRVFDWAGEEILP